MKIKTLRRLDDLENRVSALEKPRVNNRSCDPDPLNYCISFLMILFLISLLGNPRSDNLPSSSSPDCDIITNKIVELAVNARRSDAGFDLKPHFDVTQQDMKLVIPESFAYEYKVKCGWYSQKLNTRVKRQVPLLYGLLDGNLKTDFDDGKMIITWDFKKS